jgi:hypothetical protein
MDTSCRVYRYTYHRSGRAIFDSLSPVDAKLVQRSTAVLNPATFDALAQAVFDDGFFRLEPRYSTGTTDIVEITVRVGLPDTVKMVVEEAGAGPAALHGVQSLLDSIGRRLSWEAVHQ